MRRRKFTKPYLMKRRTQKSRFLWTIFLMLIILGEVLYLISFPSIFQIKKIKISGNQKVKSQDLENIVRDRIERQILFFSSKSIFLANLNQIEKETLKIFPQVAETSLKRDFPDILLFQVEERKPAAVFSQDKDYFFIDKEGIIFEKIEENSSEMLKIKTIEFFPNLSLGKKIIEKDQLSKILDIESILERNLKIHPTEAWIISAERFNVKIEEGWEIYLNPKESIDWQLTKLGAVLEEEIPPERREDLEYIELRFGNTAPYKYRSEVTAEP